MKFRVTLWMAAATMFVAQEARSNDFPAAPHCTLTFSSVPINMAIGNLFGGNQPALLVASWVRIPGPVEKYDAEQSRVLIFRQKNGTYTRPADQELVVKAPFGMAVGDFDRDGKPDLALSPYGTFDLRLGKENLLIPHLCSTPNGGAGQVISGKFDRDGLSDFVSGPVWRTWFGNEKWDQGYFCGPKINDNKLCVMTDLDDDGEHDLVFLSAEQEQIRLYYGPFLSRMVVAEELSRFAVVSSATWKVGAINNDPPLPLAYLGVGDFNGDDRVDIVASTSFHADVPRRKTYVWYQNSPTGFTDHASPSATIEGICGQLAVADINQDRLDDLVIAEAGAGTLRVFRQKPDQPFAASPQAADETIRAGMTHLFQVGDINGDGSPDIIHNDLARIRIFLNAGVKAKSR